MARVLEPRLALARALGSLSRLRGGGGTSAPGKLLMALDRNAIARLGSRLAQGSVLVSATNGKTTTAAMAAGILRRRDVTLVHNSAGANMAGGVAAALLQAARPRGQIAGELGLFEVDELWLDAVADQLHPRAVLLSNLFRDQLDRYGELETIAARWARLLTVPRLILNADDPLVADLGREREGTLYFGVDDDSLALSGMAHAADAKHCRRCGAAYAFSAVYLGHLGHYSCPTCGQRRPPTELSATDVALHGVHSAAFTLNTPAGAARVQLRLPGLYNVYNALAAAALAWTLGAGLEDTVAGLEATPPAFGRAEQVTVSLPAPARHGAQAQRKLQILLVKNPAGANEVLRTLALEPGEHDLLAVLNDNVADGRDVSWIWDADFELLAPRIRRVHCSGTRAAELAVRMKYAGVAPERIAVDPNVATALAAAAADGAGSGKPLYAIPTYTAMLELRDLLVARGEADGVWR
jgi:UDP-N-acetylmuramyl tripeptide synthase